MAIEEEPVARIPEWVVTFGDMMSLLLTFFIMLVSMSEIKEEERFQALVESLARRFGHETAILSMAPGPIKPRNSMMAKLATEGRAKRANIMKGGDKVRAISGENPRVRTIRPGQQPIVGGKIFFAEDASDLTEQHKRQLQLISRQLGGKLQKIELRGHTSRRPVSKGSTYRDHWDLAYERCRSAMEFLVSLGINPRRIRLSVVADNEPIHLGTDVLLRKQNARIEVYMLDELTTEFGGAPEPKQKRSPKKKEDKSEHKLSTPTSENTPSRIGNHPKT